MTRANYFWIHACPFLSHSNHFLLCLQILQSLSLGVDLISTNYPECLAKAGRALALRLPGDPVITEDVTDNTAADSRKHARTASESEPSTKRPRIDYSNPHALPAAASDLSGTGDAAKQSDNAGQSACANKRGPGKSAAKAVAPNEAEFPRAKCEMNLWDVMYRKDTRPLVCLKPLYILHFVCS